MLGGVSHSGGCTITMIVLRQCRHGLKNPFEE